MKRIFIVYNPRSSRFRDVKQEVLQKVGTLKGYVVGKYEVAPTDVDANACTLSKLLRNGDLIISAGGDATACIAANACLLSDKDVTLAVLPYGNFNDLARTLGLQKFEQIFYSDTKTIDYYPLEIHVDGHFFRYATCYVTIGMTAESVGIFDTPRIRQKLQKKHQKSWRSYLYLAKWYRQNHHQKVFLSDFALNGASQPSGTSDYFAINATSVCKIMKGTKGYLSSRQFQSTTSRLANFFSLASFMFKSILAQIPSTTTSGDVLDFTQPTNITLQAEGEYRTFYNIRQAVLHAENKGFHLFVC